MWPYLIVAEILKVIWLLMKIEETFMSICIFSTTDLLAKGIILVP